MTTEIITPGKADDIIQSFQQNLNQNELSTVLKELFNLDKIVSITDLSDDEIKLITRIWIISEIKGIKVWQDGLKLYMKLKLSKDRKSRREIVDAFKGIRQESAFSKLNPFNWGKR